MYINMYIKPLKSEAIHETGLSGNVVTSFFPLIIFIYIYIYDEMVVFCFSPSFQFISRLSCANCIQLIVQQCKQTTSII